MVDQGGGGCWQGGAHLVCGIHVYPLLQEAGESCEVAGLGRIEKILHRLLGAAIRLRRVAGARGRGGQAPG